MIKVCCYSEIIKFIRLNNISYKRSFVLTSNVVKKYFQKSKYFLK